MIQPAELVDRYIAMWNETDPARRHALIQRLWTEDATHLDPTTGVEGRDAIDGLVRTVQARFPGHRFERTSEVDSHNGRLRFSWALAPDRGAPALSGTDFGAVSEDGRLRNVTSFFDASPAPRPLG